jgi:hypothetical protein
MTYRQVLEDFHDKSQVSLCNNFIPIPLLYGMLKILFIYTHTLSISFKEAEIHSK